MICTVLKQKQLIKDIITPAKGVTIISKLRNSLYENGETTVDVGDREAALRRNLNKKHHM